MGEGSSKNKLILTRQTYAQADHRWEVVEQVKVQYTTLGNII
jgi:hypothetical protein